MITADIKAIIETGEYNFYALRGVDRLMSIGDVCDNSYRSDDQSVDAAREALELMDEEITDEALMHELELDGASVVGIDDCSDDLDEAISDALGYYSSTYSYGYVLLVGSNRQGNDVCQDRGEMLLASPVVLGVVNA